MTATGLERTTCENSSANFGAFAWSATTTFLSCIVKIGPAGLTYDGDPAVQ